MHIPIQEFKVQTNNLGPEWGNFAGGVMNLSTKAGTNQFHGELYEYLRNKVLNANNFQSNKAGIPTPPYVQNQFGGNVGGPVDIPGLYNGKDKTFFFFNYEGFRLREGQTLVDTLPTAAERNGNFSNLRDSKGNPIPIYDPTSTQLVNGKYVRQQISCNGALNVICPGEINPVSKNILDLWPMPNTAGNQYTNVDNWVGDYSTGANEDQEVIRLDQNFSDKQHAFARYSHRTDSMLPPDPWGDGLCLGQCSNIFSNHNLVLDDTYVFTPTFMGDFHIGFDRFSYDRKPVTAGIDLTTIGWPASLNSEIPTPFRTLPEISVSGLGNLGSGVGSTIVDRTNSWYASGELTKVTGRHTLSFGAQLWLARDNHGQTNTASGAFSFTPSYTASSPTGGIGGYGFASFLLGYPASGSSTVASLIAGQQITSSFYAGDTWQITKKLTLDLGLRYDRTGPWTERYNRQSFWDLSAQNPLQVPGFSPLYGELGNVDSSLRPSRNNVNPNNLEFAPRLGFAYSLNRQTVIRGGYGIFWLPDDIIFTTSPVLDAVNYFTTPFVSSTNGGITPTGTFSNPFPDGLIPPPGHSPNDLNQIILNEGGATAVVSNNKFAYMQQWNLDIQRQLPGAIFLDVAYAASKGTHLPAYSQDVNQLPDQDLSMGNSLLKSVPNPFYGLITSGPLSGTTTTEGQLLRPYPEYTSANIAGGSYGVSSYNSLQLKVQRRFKNGGTLLAAYTWSKLMSDVDTPMSWLEGSSGGVPGVIDWNNIRGTSYSLSAEDIPQRLVVSYVLDLPFGHGRKFLSGVTGIADKVVSGWGIDGISTFQSGWPLKLSTSRNLTNSYGGASKPNVVPGCEQSVSGSAEQRMGEWFNTSCFTQPLAFTFGSEPRVDPQLRGDGVSNFDFAIFKNIKFGSGERYGIQFRTEFFNLFNTPQFSMPGQTLGTAGFGIVSSQANDPRLVQMALRVFF